MGLWWVRRDCCGVFCAIFTIGLMVFAATVQIYFVIGPWKGYMSVECLLYATLVFMAAVSHTRCQFSDPGTVPNSNQCDPRVSKLSVSLTTAEVDELNWCSKCRIYKPYEASHCSCCQRCIVRMDHHCPWVNNCVALVNQKYFLQFLLYTGTQCFVCLVTLVGRFVLCNTLDPEIFYRARSNDAGKQIDYGLLEYCDARPADIICCILNFIEAILFGLFTFVMLFDQLHSIFANTPYIASLKGRKGVKKERYQCLKDVFGEDLSISWFLPTPPTFLMKENYQSMCQQFFG